MKINYVISGHSLHTISPKVIRHVLESCQEQVSSADIDNVKRCRKAELGGNAMFKIYDY